MHPKQGQHANRSFRKPLNLLSKRAQAQPPSRYGQAFPPRNVIRNRFSLSVKRIFRDQNISLLLELLLSEFMSVSYKQEDMEETVTYASIYSFSKSLNTIFVFLPLNTKKIDPR